jgi:signal peptidase I
MRKHLKKFWKFFWHDDSFASWVANIIVAFIVIRYLLYPVLGVVLGTSFPIVAVVSESMEHGISPDCLQQQNGMCLEYSKTEFKLCGQRFTEFYDSYENYWRICGSWYENNDISREQFAKFPFQNGFDKGDVVILWRATNVEVGDILVYQASTTQPIIHRVVKVWEEDGKTFYQTKGDHNSRSLSSLNEEKVSEERVFGKGIIRIPYFGWVKILFVDIVRPFGIIIER